MYVELYFIRNVELMIASKYSENLFRCPVHLSIGQEAIAVGTSSCLGKDDKVVSTHRSHAHYLAKGGDLSAMLSELIGSEYGCCLGRGGSMHLFDSNVGFLASVPIVGSSLPIAVGVALAEKQLQSGNIVVAYTGDAATETGAFYESLNLAALKRVPLLIILEDNDYSINANKESRWAKNKNLEATIIGMGLPYLYESGDNALVVYNLVNQIISSVREFFPMLIHFNTFRRFEHCGPNLDDQLGYRNSQEIASYSDRDPIVILRQIILKQNKVSEEILKKIETRVFKFIQKEYSDVLSKNHSYLARFT